MFNEGGQARFLVDWLLDLFALSQEVSLNQRCGGVARPTYAIGCRSRRNIGPFCFRVTN